MTHIVLHAVPSWGHTKPLLSFMVLLAESGEDVVVTLLTGPLYPQIMAELEKTPKERFSKVESRVNVIDITGSSPNYFDVPQFEDALREFYSGSGEVVCASSKKVFKNLPRPGLAIVDPVAGYAIEAVRKLATPKETPIFSWMTSSLGFTVGEWGPAHLNGRGDEWRKIINMERPEERVARGVELLGEIDDTILSVPGYPPIHRYELYPQESHVSLELPAIFYAACYKYIHETEGYISVSSSILEGDATKGWREYMEGLGKEFYEIGFIAATAETPQNDGDSDVTEFLEKIGREHGHRSLIYISFGSMWWPSNPENLYAVIDELIKSKTPFLIANPKSFYENGGLPEKVLKAIQECGFGLATKWAPQDAILQHPATGWFLSHGGWNSFQESLRYRVPMIFWPIGADQALNAVLLSVKHQAAFELISVRGGEGAKRPARFTDGQKDPEFTVDGVREELRDVLKSLKGKEGEAIRRKLDILATEIGKLWDEEGQSRKEFKLFVWKHVTRS
ncbi:hypothetical protein V5O48_011627 [Marasmius crinis-equi]|uniref:UDP-Glycosyltransferase/glycogen phosphorylase n=1 Tax=Marasmius crinis-equi TaxID=585013 RepID=A0ABR3F5E9_9AGAR